MLTRVKRWIRQTFCPDPWLPPATVSKQPKAKVAWTHRHQWSMLDRGTFKVCQGCWKVERRVFWWNVETGETGIVWQKYDI